MDDGASLDELKRRAYSSDDAGALDARRRLAVIEVQREQDAAASAVPVLELPSRAPLPKLLAAILVVLMATATALGTIAVISPKSSLDVFQRPQNGRDLEMPVIDSDAVEGSGRWVGATGAFEIFAYLRNTGDADEICVIAVELNGSHLDCVPRSEFVVDGIEVKAGRFTSTGTEYYTLDWGPQGEPRYESHSVDR